MTNGDKGSSDRATIPADLVRIRETEQRNAARALGVEHVQFLGYQDGEAEDTRQLRLDITRQIRLWRPDLVITQSPHRSYANFFGWHRDHRATAGVVLDCVYPLARDHLSFPELLPQHEPHQVRELYLMEWERPNLLVDVTETMEPKLRVIACHASQIADGDAVEARVAPARERPRIGEGVRLRRGLRARRRARLTSGGAPASRPSSG